MDEDSVGMPSKLWPLVLHNATTRAFYNNDYGSDLTNIRDMYRKVDYIYLLLVVGRESFVRVIANRGSKAGISNLQSRLITFGNDSI